MPRQTIAAKSGYHNQLQKTLTRSKEVHITDSYYSMYATKADWVSAESRLVSWFFLCLGEAYTLLFRRLSLLHRFGSACDEAVFS